VMQKANDCRVQNAEGSDLLFHHVEAG